MSRPVLVAVLLAAAACRSVSDVPAVPPYDNLGDHHYTITTADSTVQHYFDQGLRLYYAFNHAEAIRAFDEASRRDPSCAMCRWGVALALGPNINAPMDSAAGAAAWVAIRVMLRRLAGSASVGYAPDGSEPVRGGANFRYNTGVTSRAISVLDTNPPMMTHASGE